MLLPPKVKVRGFLKYSVPWPLIRVFLPVQNFPTIKKTIPFIRWDGLNYRIGKFLPTSLLCDPALPFLLWALHWVKILLTAQELRSPWLGGSISKIGLKLFKYILQRCRLVDTLRHWKLKPIMLDPAYKIRIQNHLLWPDQRDIAPKALKIKAPRINRLSMLFSFLMYSIRVWK